VPFDHIAGILVIQCYESQSQQLKLCFTKTDDSGQYLDERLSIMRLTSLCRCAPAFHHIQSASRYRPVLLALWRVMHGDSVTLWELGSGTLRDHREKHQRTGVQTIERAYSSSRPKETRDIQEQKTYNKE